MDFIHEMKGLERINLAGSGGGPPNIHSTHGIRRAEDHRAARGSFEILGMADLKSGNIGYRIVHDSFPSNQIIYS